MSTLQRLASAADSVPFDRIRLDAVRSIAGTAPAALAEWVSAETVWAPYRGLLRGPYGVLADRIGSALDRALLLHALLREAGHSARLVRGVLPVELVEPALPGRMGQLGSVLARRRSEAEGVLSVLEDALAAGPAAEVVRAASAVRLEELDGLRAASEGLAGRLGSLVGAFAMPSDEDAAAALAERWWVEWESEDGWMPLDPAAGDSDRLPMPVAEGRFSGARALPEAHIHRVRVSVVARCREPSEAVEHTLLTVALRAADFVDEDPRLVFLPDPLTTLSRDGVPDARSMRAAALSATRWTPVLRLGGTLIADRAVSVDGRVSSSPLRADPVSLGDDVHRGLGAALAALDGVGGERGPEPSAPDRLRFEAAHLVFEFDRPGLDRVVHRRELFDLDGTDADASTEVQRLRRGSALLGEVRILVAASELPEPWVMHRTLEAVPALVDRVAAVQAGQDHHDVDVPPLPGLLHCWHTFRFHRDEGSWLGEPNVVLLHTRPRLEHAEPSLAVGLDVVHNPLRRLGPSRPSLAVAQGIFETWLEDWLLGGTGTNNAAAEFDSAEDWRVLEAEFGSALLRSVSPHPGDDDLVVVASSDGTTWFVVDRAGGRTLGHGRRGWGTATEEYVWLEWAVPLVHHVGVLIAKVSCVMNAMTPSSGVARIVAATMCLGAGTAAVGGLATGHAALKGFLATLAAVIWGLERVFVDVATHGDDD